MNAGSTGMTAPALTLRKLKVPTPPAAFSVTAVVPKLLPVLNSDTVVPELPIMLTVVAPPVATMELPPNWLRPAPSTETVKAFATDALPRTVAVSLLYSVALLALLKLTAPENALLVLSSVTFWAAVLLKLEVPLTVAAALWVTAPCAVTLSEPASMAPSTRPSVSATVTAPPVAPTVAKLLAWSSVMLPLELELRVVAPATMVPAAVWLRPPDPVLICSAPVPRLIPATPLTVPMTSEPLSLRATLLTPDWTASVPTLLLPVSEYAPPPLSSSCGPWKMAPDVRPLAALTMMVPSGPKALMMVLAFSAMAPPVVSSVR